MLVCLAAAASLAARADAIYLKKGGVIYADSVREANGKVEYAVGDDTYTIPSSAVDHIDTGAAPARSSGAARLEAMPPLTPRLDTLPVPPEMGDKLIRDGHVDQSAIDAVEKMGSSELSAAANFSAGNFEYQHGDRTVAKRFYDRALSFAPDTAPILAMYTSTLIELHQSKQAIPYAQHLTQVAPAFADGFFLLGWAYFDSDDTQHAIPAWKQAYALRPDPRFKDALDKAERETSVENNFTEADTGHFNLHYEGGQTSDAFRHQLMDTLESDYNELVGDLGVAPRDSISVSLYTNQAFFDVTQAPTWAGALYDGKLRIPVDGLSSVTPALARVLKHELTHSFIRDITHGRCPQWLNEGVAMSEEPKTLPSYIGRQLADAYEAQRQVPLSGLEGQFTGLSPGEAQTAYYESLAAALYIRDTYGFSDLTRMLERIGEGASTEMALRETIHSGYAGLEDELGQYLKKNYGD